MGFVIPVGIKEPFEKLPTGYIVLNIDKISWPLLKHLGAIVWRIKYLPYEFIYVGVMYVKTDWYYFR